MVEVNKENVEERRIDVTKETKSKQKKKEAKAPKKVSNIDVVKKSIEKKYGNVLSKLGDLKDQEIPTVSSGSIGLDMALGRGGFALGRVYEASGPPSGGKTTLTMSVLAQAQRLGMTTCFVDAEHAADEQLFRSMGVNTDDVALIRCFNGEDALDSLELLIRNADIDVAVVDSVSALIPTAEADSDIQNQHMGLHARLMSKALRRLVPIASEKNTLLIFINQLRNKIGSYGDPTTTTGGEALPFYSTGRISVRGGAAKSSRIMDAEGNVIGHTTTFEIKKNKLAPPFRKAECDLIYGVGYDTYGEVMNIAQQFGIIERTGAWYKYKGENIANGKDNTIALLKENNDLYEEIRDNIINITGLKVYYDEQNRRAGL